MRRKFATRYCSGLIALRHVIKFQPRGVPHVRECLWNRYCCGADDRMGMAPTFLLNISDPWARYFFLLVERKVQDECLSPRKGIPFRTLHDPSISSLPKNLVRKVVFLKDEKQPEKILKSLLWQIVHASKSQFEAKYRQIAYLSILHRSINVFSSHRPNYVLPLSIETSVNPNGYQAIRDLVL